MGQGHSASPLSTDKWAGDVGALGFFCTCHLKTLSASALVPGLQSTVTASGQTRGPLCSAGGHALLHFYRCPEDLWFCFPFYYMRIGVFPTCMPRYHMCAVTREPRKGTGPPETGVTDSCEPPCTCREMNPVLLTADLFLQLFHGVLFLNLSPLRLTNLASSNSKSCMTLVTLAFLDCQEQKFY